MTTWLSRKASRALLVVTVLCIAATYVGSLHHPIHNVSVANVQDASAQELFSFLRTKTAPSDLLVFSKPRTLSLFTGREVTSLGPDEAPQDSRLFMERAGVKFLIQAAWNPPAYQELINQQSAAMREVFRNHDFQVFRLQFNQGLVENLASR